ncbi:universal stress protein [Parasphingorhabdus pacifica]
MGCRRVYRVVVGVDGSEPSRAALRWAVWHAGLLDGGVTALTAWNFESVHSPDVPPGTDFTHAVEHALSAAVESSLPAGSTTEVWERVERGHAATALLDAARDADVLVVGSRGHGGFMGALLGSVSQYCVTHASCPVVVVR